jgi:hypothetical protein
MCHAVARVLGFVEPALRAAGYFEDYILDLELRLPDVPPPEGQQGEDPRGFGFSVVELNAYGEGWLGGGCCLGHDEGARGGVRSFSRPLRGID